MFPNLNGWVIAFVALDLVVTFLVLRHVLARRKAADADADAPSPIPDLGRLREFTDAMHPRLGEFVRMNWSGDPMALADVLGMALDEAEREARARDLALDRDVLKRLVEGSIEKHGIASGAQIRNALKQVA